MVNVRIVIFIVFRLFKDTVSTVDILAQNDMESLSAHILRNVTFLNKRQNDG
jgi:ADP-glucose pyrophosphorylase